MSKEEQQRQGGKEEPSTLTAAVPTTSKKKPRRSPSAAAAAAAREPSPPPQYVGDSSSEEEDASKRASVVSLGNVVPFERKSTKQQQQHRRDANDADVDATPASANGAADAPPAGITPRLSVDDSHVRTLAQGKPGLCAMEGGIDENDEDDEADAFGDRSGGGAAANAGNADANASSARDTTSAAAAPQGWVASGGTTGNFAPCPLGRVTLLFDLNGVLLVNPRDPASGRRVPRLRPGVENLARLRGKFRLGVYSSATLQTVRRATSAVVFGMMSGSSNNDDNQLQVFELMLCRQHCRPAPKVRRETAPNHSLDPKNSSRPFTSSNPPRDGNHSHRSAWTREETSGTRSSPWRRTSGATRRTSCSSTTTRTLRSKRGAPT